MFSTIVIGAVFVISTLLIVALILDIVLSKTDIAKIEEVITGKRKVLSFGRVLATVAIWIASGIYLFG